MELQLADWHQGKMISSKKHTHQKIMYFFYWLNVLCLCFIVFRYYVPNYSERNNVTMDYNIPIVYVWLGDNLPPRYQQRLKWITFPHILIGQKQWQQLGKQFHQFPLKAVHKADILRLLYLYQYAGVYSDLDSILDYKCLMRMLPKKRSLNMAGQPMQGYPYASNLLLYVDRKHDPTVKKVLQAIKQKIKEQGTEKTQVRKLTGPNIVLENGAQKMDQVFHCLLHEQDGNWI